MSTDSVPSEFDALLPELLPKVLFAGSHKNFVGKKGSLSKVEIKKLNIPHLATSISHLVHDETLRKLSLDFLGLCRIYDKAVDFLLEDLQKIDAQLNYALYGVHEPLGKSKNYKEENGKIRVEDELDAESIESLQLSKGIDIIALFNRRSGPDKHLLVEVEVQSKEICPLSDFGDMEIPISPPRPSGSAPVDEQMEALSQAIYEVHATSTPPKTSSSSLPRHGASDVPRDAATSEVSIASTPKRKTRKPHDDTPTKRQKKSPSHSDAEEKSSASRRLFNHGEQGANQPIEQSSLGTADRVIRLEIVDNNGIQPIDERMPLKPVGNEEPRRMSKQLPQVNTVQDFGQQPTAEDSENVQHLPNELVRDNDDLQLEELTDDSIAELTVKRRKRSKQVLFDERLKVQRQIDVSDFENKKYVTLYTKKRGSTIVRLGRSSVRDLFSMPARRLKPIGPCFYGIQLLNLFRESAQPIDRADVTIPLPRDANYNKRPRFSSFRRDVRSGVSQVPSTPSGELSVLLEGDYGHREEHERKLMPPPALPSFTQEPSPQLQLPGTPIRKATEPITSAVSPARRSVPTINITEPIVAEEAPLLHVHLPEIHQDPDRIQVAAGNSDPRSHHVIFENSNVLPMSPFSTVSERERRTLMGEHEFYMFLKDLWATRSNVVDLEVVIPPRVTLVTFHRYFTFLQRLQRDKSKLRMKQEIIYGPVKIIKETYE